MSPAGPTEKGNLEDLDASAGTNLVHDVESQLEVFQALQNSSNNNEVMERTTGATDLTEIVNNADEDTPILWHEGIEPSQAICQAADDNHLLVPASEPNLDVEDETKPKTSSGIETLVTPDDYSPPTPSIVHDSPKIQKLSQTEGTNGVNFDQSACPPVPSVSLHLPPPAKEAENYLNRDQACSSHEVDINYGRISFAPINQGIPLVPSSSNDARSQSLPNEYIHDDDEKEDVIVIPEAFLVETDAPDDASLSDDVVIGTPLELSPHHSWHEERRTKLMFAAVCFIVVVFSIALGISLPSLSNADDGSMEKVIYNTVVVVKTSPPSLSVSPSWTPTLTPSPSDVPSGIPTASFSFSPSMKPSVSPAPSSSIHPSLFPSLIPSVSTHPSSLPTLTSPPSAQKVALFDVDCNDYCWPMVAFRGDTAVVTRDEIDIHFFLFANSTNPSASFELVTKIDIDYPASSSAIDGNTAVIGSTNGNGKNGSSAYVYERDQDGIWYLKDILKPRDFRKGEEGQANYISNGTLFGRSVAIDGDVIIVGADDDGEVGEGSAYIFRRNNTTWIEEEKLTAPRLAEGYGYSVSIKGNVAVVSDVAYGNDQEGAVFIYQYESLHNSWNKSVTTLLNENCSFFFGSYVRLTYNDGLFVGCESNNATHYYVKQINASGENEYILRQKIRYDNYLYSIDVDGDIMVTSEARKSIAGRIHFLVRKDHIWEQFNEVDEPNFDSSFGSSVALSGNLTLVATGKNVYLL
ncbi:hypothetical protein HJC23_000494 [Cyclotella cryptica]|uniref:Uncharacterized protein n=1 Tax=Cyclotella cryptica TaxID=29204 RepID=A0ABD3QBA7_9STRA